MNGITNFAIRSSFSLEIIYEFIFRISLVIFLTRKMFLTLKKKKKKKKKSSPRGLRCFKNFEVSDMFRNVWISGRFRGNLT